MGSCSNFSHILGRDPGKNPLFAMLKVQVCIPVALGQEKTKSIHSLFSFMHMADMFMQNDL